MVNQSEHVRRALGDDLRDVPVHKALCFVEADWSLFARPLRFGDVHVVWPRALGKLLRAEGGLDRERIELIERRLGSALPRA
jgi:hypothetical protein